MRHVLRWAVTLCFLLGATVTAGPVGRPSALPEYQVKAAFLANFLSFVQWPAARVPAAPAPFVLGVYGTDPFGPYLREAVAGRTALGRPIEVRRVASLREVADVHVLFIAGGDVSSVREVVRRAEAAQVLTVADADGFARTGVVLNLFIDDHRVRFEANQAAAQRSGLRLSSQLLKMARLVEDRP